MRSEEGAIAGRRGRLERWRAARWMHGVTAETTAKTADDERHAMERDGASKGEESTRGIGDRPELRRNAAERRTLSQSRCDGSLRDVAGLLPVPRAGAIGALDVR